MPRDIHFPDVGPASTSSDVLARRCAVLLEDRGLNGQLLAAAYGLSLDGEPEDGLQIPTYAKRAYIGSAVLLAHDPLFTWQLGDVRLGALGLVGYAALNAPTVGEALQRLVQAMPTVSTAVYMNVAVDGDTAMLVASTSDPRIDSLFTLRFMLSCLDSLIGASFAPLRVGLALTDRDRQPIVAQQLKAPLGADELFSYVAFPARHLRTRVAGADARLAEVLRPYWERRVEDGSRRMDVVRTRLEGAVIRNLHEGTPSLDRLAETLDTSRASLAREIAAVGGMRLLVDTVRRRLAEELVAKPGMTLAQVAGVLGFSEAAALSHAYRRWRGGAPAVDRRIIVPVGFTLRPSDRHTEPVSAIA
ncbi:MAG: AraC family transcriptional regulator ligand-binding domain-containing protein [Geminicoccaceae bacterium]